MLIHRNSTTNRVPPAFAVPSPRAPRVLLYPALARGHEHANAALSIPPSPLYVGLGTNAHSTRASAHDAPRLVVRLSARRKIIRVDIPHVPFRGAARRPEKEQTSPQRSKVPTPPPHARTSSLPPLNRRCRSKHSTRVAAPGSDQSACTSALNRAPGSAQSFAKACGAAVLDGIPGLSRLCAVSGYSARLPTRSVYKLRRLTQPGTLSCTGPRCFVLPIRRRRLSRRGRRSHTKRSCHRIPTRMRRKMRRWPRAHCL